jgi:hypothetical protein
MNKNNLSSFSARATADAEEQAHGVKIVRETHEKKPKVVKTVKDTFSFPVADHAMIGDLMALLLKNGVKANKSEIIRAGLHALNGLSQEELMDSLEGIDRIPVGRPKG